MLLLCPCILCVTLPVALLCTPCPQFAAGPGNDTMTIKLLLSRSWQFKNVVTTTQTFVAPKLQPPPRPFVLAKAGPAPLVTAVEDCPSFNVSVKLWIGGW